MKKIGFRAILLTMIIFTLSTTMAFADELNPSVVNANNFGVLTLIPPIIAIVLAFITKNVVISLSRNVPFFPPS